ncbi:MAG: M56 family metallopeptidase, partial [Planctomycetaceae bacterium]
MSYSLMTVETLGWMLIHSVWIIAAVAVLDSFIKLLLRRRSANARYLAGCAALLLSAASLPISLVFLVEQVAVIQHEDATALRGSISVSRSKEITAPDGTEMSISWDEQLTLPIKELDQHLTSQTAPTSTPSVDPPFVERLRELVQPHLSKIVTGWFIGIVLLSIRPLLGWRHARRLRSTGIVDVSEDVQRLFAALMHRISMTRAVQLVESQLVQIPSVVGAFKPVILLPATAMTGLTPDQLQAVLAHELAHIRRHDYLINGLQTAIETLLFYHPAIWWMSRRVRIERENCCDDFVVTLLDNSAEYCRALVTIDRLRQGSPLPVLAMHATDGSLLARVRRLAGVESPSRFSNSPAIVL